MNLKRQFISDLYHYVGEMIILSIILLLPINYYYDWIPAWGTLLIVAPLCLLFLLLEKRKILYKYYYFIIPPLVIAFILLGFPLLFSVIVSYVTMWRYLHIRQVLVIGKEVNIILVTAMFSVIVFIISKNIYSIGFLFMQLLMLVFGFMYSQSSTIENKSWLKYRVFIYFVLVLCLGGGLAFWISGQPYLVKVWDSFIYFLFSVIGRILYLFDFTGVPNPYEEMGIKMGGMKSETEFLTENNWIGAAFGGYLTIGLIISIIGFFTILLIFKKDKSLQEGIKGIMLEHGLLSENDRKYAKHRIRFKQWRIGKKHPVRVMIHKLERRARRLQLGRQKSETIDEWMDRIGLKVNISVYQKVRYGEMNVSEQEIEALRLDLERFNSRNKMR